MKKVIWIIVAVVCVALSGCIGMMYTQNLYEEKIATINFEYEAEIQILKDEKAGLELKVGELEAQIQALEDENAGLELHIDELEEQIHKIMEDGDYNVSVTLGCSTYAYEAEEGNWFEKALKTVGFR